jgi:hypothetical protein
MATDDRARAATRVRTATRARAALVRNTRPLEIPEDPPDRAYLPARAQPPGRLRRGRLARRWSDWLLLWRPPSP